MLTRKAPLNHASEAITHQSVPFTLVMCLPHPTCREPLRQTLRRTPRLRHSGMEWFYRQIYRPFFDRCWRCYRYWMPRYTPIEKLTSNLPLLKSYPLSELCYCRPTASTRTRTRWQAFNHYRENGKSFWPNCRDSLHLQGKRAGL